jgi:dolichol-phosphate mannosyltransferase
MKQTPQDRPPVEKIAVVIPALNEEGCIESTVRHLHLELNLSKVPHEIVVVDDGSTDNTWQILTDLVKEIPTLRPTQNTGAHGFGRAVVWGLNHARADGLVVMMADNSDDCRDVVRYWQKLNEGYDCVFGSRFMKGGGVIDYPIHKLILNRIANLFVTMLFAIPYNDTTNAFKAYRRRVIDECAPFISPHFNLTIEIPLKAIVRGYSWTTIPITWRNRRSGLSKLKIQEMGSRYLFICLYVWLEKTLTSDYRTGIANRAQSENASTDGEKQTTAPDVVPPAPESEPVPGVEPAVVPPAPESEPVPVVEPDVA